MHKSNEEYKEIQYSESVLADEVNEEEVKQFKKKDGEILQSARFDLDMALETYDPAFPKYTPSREAFEFFNLLRLVQGADFEFSSPIAHFFMVDMLLGNIKDPMCFPYSADINKTVNIDPKDISFCCSRGMSKSTIVLTFFVIYSAIKGKLTNFGNVYFYLCLSASTKGGARTNALAVRAMCEDSQFIKEYFEHTRFTETEIEFIRKGNGPKAGRTFIARFLGVGSGIRGQRAGAGTAESGSNTRPNAIIFDDIILNTAVAYSKTIQENLKTIIESDSVNALVGGGRGRLINCFTPFHYSDCNVEPMISGSTTPVVIPVASKFDFTRDVKPQDLKSSWDDMHPVEAIAKQFNKGLSKKDVKLFLQERMLQLSSDSDRLIPESKIQWCDMSMIITQLHNYTVYITTDFTSTSGEKSDFSGVATWAVNSNDDWFLLNITLSKRTIPMQYAAVLDEAAKLKRKGILVELGVEIDGNQATHVVGLEYEMMRRNDWYPFAKSIYDTTGTKKGILNRSSGKSKHERFRLASMFFVQEKIWFNEKLKDVKDMKEFLMQIRGATHVAFTRADDGPDLVSMLYTINRRLPMPMPVVENSNVIETFDPFFEEEEEIVSLNAGYV